MKFLISFLAEALAFIGWVALLLLRLGRRWLWEIVIICIVVACLTILLTGCGGIPRVGTSGLKPPAGGGSPSSDANALLLWLSAVSILGFGGCVAAAVFLPVKKLALAGCAGFASTLVLALTTKAALPYLPWVALALGLIGLVLGLWRFRQWVNATKAAVAFGCDMAKASTDQETDALKYNHATAQEKLGVRGVIDQVIGQIKAKGG